MSQQETGSSSEVSRTETERLFFLARNLHPQEREEFLRRECGDDRERYSEVLSLLQCDDGACVLDKPLEDILLQGRRIGPFIIEGPLAVGGMGAVFKARQSSPSRVVALKVLRQGIDSSSAQRRFDYEVEVLGRLRHPFIAEIYAAGVDTSLENQRRVPYFAMEYVEGAKAITAHCVEKGLGGKARIAIFRDVCIAVHHGHQKGILHRDLKPSNILVTEDGQPKVIDFGLAKAISGQGEETQLTGAGQIVGTTRYMSPEQCAGLPNSMDVRSDVYSLGVVLYEVLCGRLPYDVPSDSVFAASRAIREERPLPPSCVDPSLRGDIERIALKALEKDPTQRYQSAWDLAGDLTRYLESRPILARPPGLLYLMTRFARRHRWVVASILLAILTSIVGAVGTLNGLASARASAREAETQAQLALSREKEARAARTVAEAQANREQGMVTVLSEVLRESVRRTAHREGAVILDIMEKTAETLSDDVADLPEITAVLYVELGNNYLQAGDLDRAQSHLQKGLSETMKFGGATTFNALNARYGLLRVGIRLGREKQADARLKELQRMLAMGGSEDQHPMHRTCLRIQVHSDLGSIMLQGGRIDEARKEFEQSVALASDHEDVSRFRILALYARVCLARCDEAQGDIDGAEAHWEESLRTYESEPEVDSTLTAHVLNEWAGFLLRQSRFEEALDHLEDLFIELDDVLEEAHPYSLITLVNLAQVHLAMNDPTEAIPVLRRVQEIVDQNPDVALHGTETVRSLALVLGKALIEVGEAEMAEPILREALERARKGDEPQLIQSYQHALADCARALGLKARD